MSEEEKQKLKDYPKNYREARKLKLINSNKQIYFLTHYRCLKWHK